MIDANGNDKQKAYIGTYTGKQFYLLEPRLEDIDIQDIAHGLAMQCRWTGQCKFHYSIAQHSVYCSLLGPPEEAFDRLMHDAPEAYIGDLNRPLKHYTEAGVAYRRQEAIIQEAIATRFGYSVVEPKSVKLADNSMLYAEKDQLLNLEFEEAENWDRYDEDNGIIISQWTPEQAKQRFLDKFAELYNRRIN
jgi:5'-deoxynucleotidase YfbR-like HD superfamily hydrolase